MRRTLLALVILLGCASTGDAQQNLGGASPVAGQAVNRSTLNLSNTVTTGNTFQIVLQPLSGAQRQAVTIQNNNTSTDNCWLFLGSGSATEAKSILLAPGQAYQRYWPYVPSDEFQITCASTSDTFYADVQ